jgi:hypothetical protein
MRSGMIWSWVFLYAVFFWTTVAFVVYRVIA